MRIRSLATLDGFINLFNPPPLASMTQVQKIGRIFLISTSIVVGSILLAMLGALGIFLVERGHEMLGSIPDLLRDLGIIVTSVAVNALCVFVLLQIKKADQRLMVSVPETKTRLRPVSEREG